MHYNVCILYIYLYLFFHHFYAVFFATFKRTIDTNLNWEWFRLFLVWYRQKKLHLGGSISKFYSTFIILSSYFQSYRPGTTALHIPNRKMHWKMKKMYWNTEIGQMFKIPFLSRSLERVKLKWQVYRIIAKHILFFIVKENFKWF